MESNRLRTLLLLGTPIALAVLLLFHPHFDGAVYEGLRDEVTQWIVVHIGLAVGAGLMAWAGYVLLDGLAGRAATVSRVALATSSLFVLHDAGPVGTIGLLCFAAAAAVPRHPSSRFGAPLQSRPLLNERVCPHESDRGLRQALAGAGAEPADTETHPRRSRRACPRRGRCGRQLGGRRGGRRRTARGAGRRLPAQRG